MRTATTQKARRLLILAAVPIMGPFAYGFGLNALQILGYLPVAVACIPVASTLISRGRHPEAG